MLKNEDQFLIAILYFVAKMNQSFVKILAHYWLSFLANETLDWFILAAYYKHGYKVMLCYKTVEPNLLPLQES